LAKKKRELPFSTKVTGPLSSLDTLNLPLFWDRGKWKQFNDIILPWVVAQGKERVQKMKKGEIITPQQSLPVEVTQVSLVPSYEKVLEGIVEGAQQQSGKWIGKLYLLSFKDNSGVHYREGGVKIGRELPSLGIDLVTYLRRYSIEDNGEATSNSWYGVQITKYPWSFSIDTEGYQVRVETEAGFTFSYSRAQLLPTRRSYCSKDLKVRKAEVSYYHSVEKHREFWGSIAYEWVSDGNRVITPQFDWDLAKLEKGNWEIVPNLSGWYNFNSLQTDCYYSPARADSTLLNLKLYHPAWGGSYFYLKGGIGYSFFDKIIPLELDLWLKRENFWKIGCNFSRSTSRGGKPYQSRECKFEIEKRW
jgi:hypothetical protein